MTLFELLTQGTECLERAESPDAGNDAKLLLLEAFGLDMNAFSAEPDAENARGSTRQQVRREVSGVDCAKGETRSASTDSRKSGIYGNGIFRE